MIKFKEDSKFRAAIRNTVSATVVGSIMTARYTKTKAEEAKVEAKGIWSAMKAGYAQGIAKANAKR